MKLSSKIPTATLLLLVLAAGCQTNKPAQSPPAFADAPKSPAPPPAPAPVAAPAQPAEEHARILPPSASAAPLPFQGEGWEALLDGKTLKGWKEGPFAGHGEIEIESGAVICAGDSVANQDAVGKQDAVRGDTAEEGEYEKTDGHGEAPSSNVLPLQLQHKRVHEPVAGTEHVIASARRRAAAPACH